MNTTYSIAIIDAESRQPHSEIRLPILPPIGTNVIVGTTNYTILGVTIQADQITIARPNPGKTIISPGAPTPQVEDEMIIPIVVFAKITEIQMEPTQTS